MHQAYEHSSGKRTNILSDGERETNIFDIPKLVVHFDYSAINGGPSGHHTVRQGLDIDVMGRSRLILGTVQ